MEILQYVFYLLLTLGILVTFHELGHFVIARASGVKVVRFSIGFGRPIYKHVDRRGTEFVVAMIPLGGYVRMLDERDEDVAPEDEHLTVMQLSVWWRIAIALGGPVANFILAFLVYWFVFVVGATTEIPVLGPPAEDSPAYLAGLRGGEEIVGVDGTDTASWPEVTMALAARLGDTGEILVEALHQDLRRTYPIPIQDWHRGEDEPMLTRSLGFYMMIAPVIVGVEPDSAAEAGGLAAGDRVIAVDDEPVRTWSDFVLAVQNAPETQLSIVVERNVGRVNLQVTPQRQEDANGTAYGYVGARRPEIPTRVIAYSPIDAVGRGLEETWSKTVLTLNLLKKMVQGAVSPRNLSGPITIAKVAGDSAQAGWEYFLNVLALLSISLGVINLLPIPVLDGGHIMFGLAEVVTRKPVSERVQAVGVQIGLVMVGSMIILAFYNDIARLLG